MDPTACLERLREAYGTDDRDEIESAADDLLRWIRAGGFLPTVSEPMLSALLLMARSYGALMDASLNILNDCEPGENARLTVSGYNALCKALRGHHD